jgi:hypothetical protein
MGTKFWEALWDEHGIGGSGEYCGDNDAHFGRIDVVYDEASGSKYVVFFHFELGVIGAVALSRRSANSSSRKTS